MTSVLQKMRAAAMLQGDTKAEAASRFPTVVRTEYHSMPVNIPENFLAPVPDPSTIKVCRVDFKNSPLNEYRNLYAVVIDDVLSQKECDELIRMAEMSVGAHREEEGPENNGWRPAMVNAGRNHEVLALHYRNSDRIIWDNHEIVKRIFQRILQGEGMKEYLSILDGKEYVPVVGDSAGYMGETWVITEQGPNERMRFLKYGPGQFFKEHCDGTYETPDGSQRSFYTLHLYLNDSAQALGIPEGSDQKDSNGEEYLRGGATTFHSVDLQRKLDIDPRAGRVLIFQHRRLLHSGDTVTAGTKYTMRSDLMYEWQEVNNSDDIGDVIFE